MESPRSAAATIWSFRRPKVRTSAPEIMVFFPKSQVFMAFGSNFFSHFSERTKKNKIGPNRCARCTLLTCLCLCLPTIVTIHQCIFAPNNHFVFYKPKQKHKVPVFLLKLSTTKKSNKRPKGGNREMENEMFPYPILFILPFPLIQSISSYRC